MNKKILVADVPQMDSRYLAALAGEPLVFVHTMAEAKQALAGEAFDLVVVGVHFDDSQMFDLVRHLRGDESRRKLPIVCVRGRPGFTAISSRTLEVTVKALAADEFLDLLQYGDENAGDAALRAIAERLLAAR